MKKTFNAYCHKDIKADDILIFTDKDENNVQELVQATAVYKNLITPKFWKNGWPPNRVKITIEVYPISNKQKTLYDIL